MAAGIGKIERCKQKQWTGFWDGVNYASCDFSKMVHVWFDFRRAPVVMNDVCFILMDGFTYISWINKHGFFACLARHLDSV